MNYTFINRGVNFDKNSCYKITDKSLVARASASTIDRISSLYHSLLSNSGKFLPSDEVEELMATLKAKLSKRLIRRKEPNGYVSMSILGIGLTLIISILSFVIIGHILGR